MRRALDIEELRQMALRRLPGFAAEYLEGGAEDERTLRRNRDAFDDRPFVHRVLVPVAERSTSTTILGKPAALPLVIAPTGFNGLYWRHGDIALARAAREHDIPFTCSIVASDSIEAIAEQAGGRLWMQILVLRDAAANEKLISRANDIGCDALVITLDAPVLGNRTWDQRNFARPFALSLRAKLDVLCHLRWLFGVYLPRGLPGFGNLALGPSGSASPGDASRYLTEQGNPALDWDAIKRLRERWKHKLVLKGVMSVADAEEAARLGADAIILSNHGGRQLDGEAAPFEVLGPVVAAVGARLEVMIDGGFRRGTDIVKALALGARAIVCGRATLYGLAAGGQPGVARALAILRGEIDRTLALLGCPGLAELSPECLLRS